MESYISQIGPYLQQYGYWIVFSAILLENFGLPLPGETMLITAAILASQGGRLSLVPLILTAWGAAVLGDNCAYGLGRWAGRRLVIQYGQHVFITHERIKRVETGFNRYGGIIVLFARFFEVFRQLNGLVAGTMEMPWRRFLFYNTIGGGLWVCTWTILFYWLGDRAGLALRFFKKFEADILVAIAVLTAGYLVYRLVRWYQARAKQ